MTRIPTYGDVHDAVKRLDGHALKTPLLRADALDRLALAAAACARAYP